MEPEAHLLTFLEHPGPDRCWSEVIFDQHVGCPWSLSKVAMARKLAVRLYWMWRKGWDYEQVKKFGSHAGQPGNRDGVPSNTQ